MAGGGCRSCEAGLTPEDKREGREEGSQTIVQLSESFSNVSLQATITCHRSPQSPATLSVWEQPVGSSALARRAGGCRAQSWQPRSRRAESHIPRAASPAMGRAICAVSVALSPVPRHIADLSGSSCACDATPVSVLLWDSWKSPGSALACPA